MRGCRTVPTFPSAVFASAVFALALFALAGCGGDNKMVPPAQTYCEDLIAQGCVRAFECVPPADRTNDFYVTYGTTIDECHALPNRCVDYPAACPDFEPDVGAICLSDFTTQTCAQLLFIQNGVPVLALPSSCSVVCPP
jgi:hypothetical protein